MLGSSASPAEGFGVTFLGHSHRGWMKLGIDLSYIVSHSPCYNTLRKSASERPLLLFIPKCVFCITSGLSTAANCLHRQKTHTESV